MSDSLISRMAGALTPDNVLDRLRAANRPMFRPGFLLRSDGLPVDETLIGLAGRFADAEAAGADREALGQIHALAQRITSISDLTPALYAHLRHESAATMNWLPPLVEAVEASGSRLRVPATSLWLPPIELAQYLRLEYQGTNLASRVAFDEIVAEALALDTAPGSEYFLKAGSFSGKFEFGNCRCREPWEAGQYLHAINNMAMPLGAATALDLCAREYIAPEPGTPEIYHGMPLRCEVRAFVDLGGMSDHPDTGADDMVPGHGLLGLTPYWHPTVMRRALDMARSGQVPGTAHIVDDYDVYIAAERSLTERFEAGRDRVADALRALLEPLREAGLRGAWSVDVMLDREDMWVIDAAPMRSSALTDLLKVTDEYTLVQPSVIDRFADELVLDALDPRSKDMTPGPGLEPGQTYRYHWNQASLG